MADDVTPPKVVEKKAAPRKAKPKMESPPTRKVGRPPKFRPGPAVTEVIEQAGAALGMMGAATDRPTLAYDGQVLAARAAEIGSVVGELCDQNPAMAAAIERMFKAGTMGVYVKLAMVTAGTAIPMAIAHGVIAPDALGPLLGVVLPTGTDGQPMLPPAPPDPQPGPAPVQEQVVVDVPERDGADFEGEAPFILSDEPSDPVVPPADLFDPTTQERYDNV